MICFPNAKINLGLFVTEKRADGYHNLETVFFPVKISDALEIIPAEATSISTHGLAVAGDTQQNLVWKAWELLKKDFPEQLNPVQIQLLKNIPMGAGMGGGSADGAFMLELLNQFFRLDLSKAQLAAYALQLGSDCPFFIYNEPCFAGGRGELLQPITLDLSDYTIQIICPEVHISTATAFSNIQPKQAAFDLQGLSELPVEDWKKQVFNDFEGPVFKAHPELAEIKEQLYAQGAIYAAMSGTGSTIYGIFKKGQQAIISLAVPFTSFVC
ncbi:MAG: 4-(cytidine 5'-diphospho)-2-C-methyl-D-erythritol kinase [Bacteroidetes bacterium 43-16]|nr:MAG: 4-(cytidine 5'-diphospho)-2-C-methyl-D-erythritol kinase [Bacteroidetes bacterium 43-16]